MRTSLLPHLPPVLAFALTGAGAGAGAGCADRELGDVSRDEAITVYNTVTSELRNVHIIVLGPGGEPPREPYNYGCASGSIQLRVGLDEDMQPARLDHTMDQCTVDGLTFDGAMDYANLDPCDESSGTFAFSGGGLVDLAGTMDGFCYIQVRNECGEVSGHICGFAARDLMP